MCPLRLQKLFLAIILVVCPALTQILEEDVVILRSGRVFRGTITDKLTPGGTISVTQSGGSVAALFWQEIAVVKRLPAGIPDSVLVRSFLNAGSGQQTGAPRIDLRGYQRTEDVLFINDGTVMRGLQLDDGIDGRIGLWVDGSLRRVPQSMVVKSVRVDRGMPDSLLVMTHINPPKEWSEGESRIFALFGGFAMPAMGEAKVDDLNPRTLNAAPLFGLEAGISIGRGLRWLTSASYSSHLHGSIAAVGAIEGVQAEELKARIITVLTGAELRTFGPSTVQLRGFLQAGILLFSEPGQRFSFPQTFTHLAGEGAVADMSANALAFSAGGGIVIGRINIDARWILCKPQYVTRTEIRYQYGNGITTEATDERLLNIFLITAGVSLF